MKYPPDPGVTVEAQEDVIVGMRAIATLVRRPKLGGWRVHALGDYVPPNEVPCG